jgi:hypothetical protein
MPGDIETSNSSHTFRGRSATSTWRNLGPSWSSIKNSYSDLSATYPHYSDPDRLPFRIRSDVESLNLASIESMSKTEAIAAAEYATATA